MKCHISSGHFIALFIGESIKHIIFVSVSRMLRWDECAMQVFHSLIICYGAF